MRPDPTSLAIALALAPLLGGCLENEEEIGLALDGSVTVRVSAKGDVSDLLEGFPLPSGGPWRAVDDGGRSWLHARANGLGPDESGIAKDQQVGLTASFPAPGDVPRRFAPASHPYSDAFLTRELEVERRGQSGRTVFSLERRYVGREPLEGDLWKRAVARLPEDVRARAEEDLVHLGDAEWDLVVAELRALLDEAAGQYARDALLGIYTRGSATLSVDGHERVVRRARERAREVYSVEAFAELRDLFRAERSEELGRAGRALEERGRDALRRALRDGLGAEGVAVETANAALGRLEWRFTARDHDDDLADERFTVRIAMPGTIVGGNYDRIENGRAVWERRGEDLVGADWRMRVVSVVE